MGASSFAFWVMLLMGDVAALGVHALASVSAGAEDRRGVGDVVVQGLWFSLICGVLAVVSRPLLPLYFQLIGVAHKPAVLAAGLAYLRGIVWGVIPLTASGVLASGFKGVAVLGPVLLVNVVCVVLNYFLDPVLMWGFCGIPAMGVAGAAVATDLCALASVVLSLWLLLKSEIPVKASRPNLKVQADITKIGLAGHLGRTSLHCNIHCPWETAWGP